MKPKENTTATRVHHKINRPGRHSKKKSSKIKSSKNYLKVYNRQGK